ncbi:MAG: hypothetical protein B6I34_07190 [Anaerolineaceae bacterium 4572_32.1]|nr:MAG: hypothetical protein B6I34_07190 [Anaerolineaceae bacterium 4572_32.1]
MNVGKAFTFIFDDENWIVKILIGGVLSLIPFVGVLLLYGYGMQVMKNVIKEKAQPLPEWSDWGDILVKGLMYLIISFVYALPIVLLGACYVLLIGAIGAAASEDTINVIASFGGICYGGFALLYAIFMMLALPPALGRYLDTGELGAAFRLSEVFALVRDNIGAWLIALVITWLAGMIASVGIILCVVGVLFTAFWANLVMMYLWGDVYRQARAKSVAV